MNIIIVSVFFYLNGTLFENNTTIPTITQLIHLFGVDLSDLIFYLNTRNNIQWSKFTYDYLFIIYNSDLFYYPLKSHSRKWIFNEWLYIIIATTIGSIQFTFASKPFIVEYKKKHNFFMLLLLMELDVTLTFLEQLVTY